MEELQKTIIEVAILILNFLGWNVSETNKIEILSSEPIQIVEQTENKKIEEVKNQIKETKDEEKIEPAKEKKIDAVKNIAPKTEEKTIPILKEVKEIVPVKQEIETVLSPKERIKKSSVNIYCSWFQKNGVLKTTGSGIIISENGVVLTNAHVAQYLLLQDFLPKGELSCFIRSGSPARKSFKGKVSYIPLSWANQNKGIALNLSPIGTGENDFALIELDSPQNEGAVKNASWLETTDDIISQNEKIFISGYPANFGNGEDPHLLENSLYLFLDEIITNEILTFNNFGDAFGTSPTIMAVHGVSGGGAIDSNLKVKGIMVATTIDKNSGKPNLRVISIPYIKKRVQTEYGKSMEQIIKNIEREGLYFRENYGQQISNIILGK